MFTLYSQGEFALVVVDSIQLITQEGIEGVFNKNCAIVSTTLFRIFDYGFLNFRSEKLTNLFSELSKLQILLDYSSAW